MYNQFKYGREGDAYMVLVDKDIMSRMTENEPLISNFNEDNLGAISYDLTLECILVGNDEFSSYELAPGGFLFIKAREHLAMPLDLIGRIEEKNSRMRMGLVVTGPTYQPGHKTGIFLRIHNISNNIITLRKGTSIAQIVFEKLNDIPDTPYHQNSQASYNNEFVYSEYGNYETEYKKDIKEMERIKENLEEKETQIYGNILTFVGILMGIFSIVTLNLEAFASADLSSRFILIMNLSITLAIELLMSIIIIFINKKVSAGKIATCIIVILSTIALIFGAMMF